MIPKSTSITETKVKTKYGIWNKPSFCFSPRTNDSRAAWIQKATKNEKGTTPDESAKYKKVLCGGTSLTGVILMRTLDTPTPIKGDLKIRSIASGQSTSRPVFSVARSVY